MELFGWPIEIGVDSGSGCSTRLDMPMVVPSRGLVYSYITRAGRIVLLRACEYKTFLHNKLLDEALLAAVSKRFLVYDQNEPQMANIPLIEEVLFELRTKSHLVLF